MELDDGEAGDGGKRLEHAGDVRHAVSVAVVLDDRENRPATVPAKDLGGVVSKARGIDFDPGIERRIANRRYGCRTHRA